MSTSTFMGLIYNAALLLALGLLYDTLLFEQRSGRMAASKLVTGVFTGLLGIAVMLTPWEFMPGVVFDTRSVLLCVSGFFFGAVPTLVAVAVTSAFRLYTGGMGMWTGVAVIATSGGMGLAWRHFRRKDADNVSIGELYFMGVVVHTAMLAWMFSLPLPTAIDVLSRIGVPVMLIFPAGTALLGRLLSGRFTRRKMEMTLRESQSFIRSVMDNLPIGIAVNTVDPAVKFDYMNDNFVKFYRTTREALADPDPNAFWNSVYEDPDFRGAIRQRVLDDCASGDPARMYWPDVPIARKGRETAFITAQNMPIKEKNIMISTVSDVTERNRAEAEIRALNRDLELRIHQRTAELEEANKEIEDFVYSVSHDLRAPLRSISGFAEIINRRHKQSLNEEGRHYFDNIVKAGRQMGDLIDDLLKFSRMGRKAIRSERVCLNEVFKTVLDTLADPIRKADVHVHLPERMPAIQGDPTLAAHIFINLLENAVKYRHPNEPPRIDVAVAVEEPYAVVSVADNGIGIAPAYHEKIFNIFQRLHSQADYPGTGIGLAAVKKAVQMSGGRVWVESAPGKGSIFKVQLRMAVTS